MPICPLAFQFNNDSSFSIAYDLIIPCFYFPFFRVLTMDQNCLQKPSVVHRIRSRWSGAMISGRRDGLRLSALAVINCSHLIHTLGSRLFCSALRWSFLSPRLNVGLCLDFQGQCSTLLNVSLISTARGQREPTIVLDWKLQDIEWHRRCPMHMPELQVSEEN
jgi:hypothetical protein